MRSHPSMSYKIYYQSPILVLTTTNITINLFFLLLRISIRTQLQLYFILLLDFMCVSVCMYMCVQVPGESPVAGVQVVNALRSSVRIARALNGWAVPSSLSPVTYSFQCTNNVQLFCMKEVYGWVCTTGKSVCFNSPLISILNYSYCQLSA